VFLKVSRLEQNYSKTNKDISSNDILLITLIILLVLIIANYISIKNYKN
jgi:hypothetical protein